MDGPRSRGYGACSGYDVRTRCIRGCAKRRSGVSPGLIEHGTESRRFYLGRLRGRSIADQPLSAIQVGKRSDGRAQLAAIRENLPNGSIRPAAVLPIQSGNVREGRKADIGATRGPIPGASSSRVSGPRELAMRMELSLVARTARASRPAPVMAYVMSVSTSVVAGNSDSGSRPRGAYLLLISRGSSV
jgi:hypothetical protein